MLNDNRKGWEIDWSCWIGLAHGYVRYLGMDEREQQVYAKVYGVAGSLTEWARGHIENALARADAIVEAHVGEELRVRGAVRRYVDELCAAGFSGSALAAGTTRIDASARRLAARSR